MTDSATHPKVIALRAILTRLSEQADEYAKIYEKVHGMSKDNPARKELADQLTATMLAMFGQTHLIQCRFGNTLVDVLGVPETFQLINQAMKSAHDHEQEETKDLRDLLKAHVPWQM
jgi:hypothetical protein